MTEAENPNPPSPADQPSKVVAFARMAAGLAGLGLLVVLAALILREYSGFQVYRVSGVVQSEFQYVVSPSGDSLHVFQYVNRLDFPDRPSPIEGDTVLLLGGEPALPDFWRETFLRPLPVDTQIVMTVSGEQGQHEFTLQAQVESTRSFYMLLLVDILRFMIALGFIGVGLWAFFAQPNSMPVRVFAWFCFTMTATMIAGVNVMPSYYSTFDVPGLSAIRQGIGVFALGSSVFWLHLQLVFPRILGFVGRHRAWVYPLVYAPWIVTGSLTILSWLKWVDIGIAEQIANYSVILLLIWFLAGFAILFNRFRQTHDRIEKRQLRLVLWGSGVGLGGFLVLLLLLNVFGNWFEGNSMRTLGTIIFGFSLLLLTPISYAYAFTRYRLLEVQGKVKRGTRYLITSALAFAILFGTIYLFIRYAFDGSGTTFGPIFLILLAFGVGRVSSRLNKFLERRFYPERHELRSRLESALESSSALGDCGKFWGQISENFRDTLGIDRVQPVFAGENGGSFALRTNEITPFSPSSEFVTRLSRERRAVFVDELLASGKTPLSMDEQKWLSGNRVALILPLIVQQRLMGFLALGNKVEQEDYIPEELSVLSLLAPQVAMASENLRLLEENVEKRRLEEQMQMARRIQEGFLPQVLPVTLGLEIATHNRFSLEVAGDYFDVMQLPDGETLIAIADVSGKGAGAALLMANLQASLRTAVEVGIPLARAVKQVNNLIFRNTPPEQYITFVAVLFNPHSSQLRFVNAGHNPPLLIRSTGSVEELPPTGLILGAIPNMEYEELSVDLNVHDLLVLFTDGVSEAMNDAEEEYGENRIKELAVRMRTEPVSFIISAIEQDVELFCGRVPMEDDSTMVLIKRL